MSPRLPTRNVPYDQNRLFTGRDDILKALHDAFMAGKTTEPTQPQAITGMGGIGKTQITIEYTYRYASEYQTVLWAKADSREVLTADFVNMAGLLGLSEKNEQDQKRTVDAVKQWLQSHPSWLLIFDNVEDLMMVRDFIPQGGKGHILLTTRSQATGGIADAVEIKTMEPDVGAHFLLRRAKITNPSGADVATAQEISREMGGLPLALDQAGAYIEEKKPGLPRYLEQYRQRRADLLKLRGRFATDHPESVITTFSLSFERVERANPASAELLRFCAFLHPDEIPEDLITEDAPELGPLLGNVAIDWLLLDDSIGELLKYSLVSRNPETRTLSIHRLVQDTVKGVMDKETQRTWAERTVRAVNHVFPDASFEKWQECQKYLPHAQKCSELIKEKGLEFPEAMRLLRQAGLYLRQRAQYSQAESLLKQMLDIREKVEPGSLDVAESLNDLGELYFEQGKHSEAKPRFERSREIREKFLGPEDVAVAESLTNLAAIHFKRNEPGEAESLFTQALNIFKQVKPEHPHVISILNSLTYLYFDQGKYEEAEQRYTEILTTQERILKPGDPELAISFDNLGLVYLELKKYTEAEPLLQRALDITERALGAEHPLVANRLNDLALLYYFQGEHDKAKYTEAEKLYQQALNINKRALDTENPDLARILHNVARLYHAQGKYTQAEDLFKQALEINERTSGPEHREVAKVLYHLAKLYEAQGRYVLATLAYEKALVIGKQTMGPTHPSLGDMQEDYNAFMLKMGNGQSDEVKGESQEYTSPA